MDATTTTATSTYAHSTGTQLRWRVAVRSSAVASPVASAIAVRRIIVLIVVILLLCSSRLFSACLALLAFACTATTTATTTEHLLLLATAYSLLCARLTRYLSRFSSAGGSKQVHLQCCRAYAGYSSAAVSLS